MKTLRRIVKLLPPAFVMRIWLDRRYGIRVLSAPGGAVARFALSVLPYAFTAALSVRVESDCRLLKYFLPYGKMKKFVRLAYNMQVGNDKLDKGVVGAIRAIMPYGIVLWWDAEDARISGGMTAKRNCPAEIQSLLIDAYGPCGQLEENKRQELARMDRMEAMTLRLFIMTGGKE